jgi:SAM-dependent methyltransferase
MSSASLGKTFLPASWHQRLQADRYPINDYVRKNFLPHLAPGIKVLDAGSGRLPEQQLRSDLLATGATLETLDFLPGEGVDHVADIADTKLPSESYDGILCMQVLEHVPDPSAVCRELFRLARPGAQVIVTAPQSAWLHNLPYHYFHFTKIGFRKLLEDAGFEVQAVDPQGGHFAYLAVLNHYTCRVIDEIMTKKGSPFWYKPVHLWLRFWLGFVRKVWYLYLDKLLPCEDDTQGWNVLCRKP